MKYTLLYKGMDIHELKDMIAAGLSQREIADQTGRSQTAIRYWLNKHSLHTNKVHKCKCGEMEESKFHPGRYTECRKCRMKWQKQRFRKFKKQCVEYKGGKCELCGYNKCFGSLDFHHMDSQQKDPNWKKMRRWTFSKVKKELDKCQLLCKNCHGEVHYSE